MINGAAEGRLKKLISGTAVLTAAAILTKIIGLFYKIPLIRYVGLEGMAYFLAANHIYVFLFVVSTSGLPVAVSIMVSQALALEERGEGEVEHIFRSALSLFVMLGAAGTVFMLLAADKIARIINIGGAAHSIRAIAPAILLACLGGAYRGYFQGRQIMRHTALSQVIEALGKLILGVAGALYALWRGYNTELVAAFAIAGITAGVGFSALYLAAAKAAHDRRNRRDRRDRRGRGAAGAPLINQGQQRGLAASLIKLALPITLSSAVISLTGLIDTALIANCLFSAGFSEAAINKLYSCYGNIAVPLFSLTPALVAPVSVASVPLISAALGSGDRAGAAGVADSAFRLTFLVALPASAGLSVFARPVIALIFPHEAEAAQLAAPALSLLALSVLTACLITTTGAILQANGRAGKTIPSMLAGAFVKIVAEYLLVSRPEINIAGAPISTFLCNLTVVAINIYFISKYMPEVARSYRVILPGGLSAVAAVGGAALTMRIAGRVAGEAAALIAAFAAAAVIYIIMIVITGAAPRELATRLNRESA